MPQRWEGIRDRRTSVFQLQLWNTRRSPSKENWKISKTEHSGIRERLEWDCGTSDSVIYHDQLEGYRGPSNPRSPEKPRASQGKTRRFGGPYPPRIGVRVCQLHGHLRGWGCHLSCRQPTTFLQGRKLWAALLSGDELEAEIRKEGQWTPTWAWAPARLPFPCGLSVRQLAACMPGTLNRRGGWGAEPGPGPGEGPTPV